MKYLIATILTALALSANAQHRPYPHHGHGGAHGWGWVVPAIVGGAVVYGMTRPSPPPPPTVVYVPQGMPLPPVGYHYEQVLDAQCSCYRWVLVQG